MKGGRILRLKPAHETVTMEIRETAFFDFLGTININTLHPLKS